MMLIDSARYGKLAFEQGVRRAFCASATLLTSIVARRFSRQHPVR
jgi:hypothetical protein